MQEPIKPEDTRFVLHCFDYYSNWLFFRLSMLRSTRKTMVLTCLQEKELRYVAVWLSLIKS